MVSSSGHFSSASASSYFFIYFNEETFNISNKLKHSVLLTCHPGVSQVLGGVPKKRRWQHINV